MTSPIYRGRFAPSPTGPLHFGSLVTALASYLEAHSRQGHWLVRIEDLDPLRESPEATDRILNSLQGHQLHPDGTVRYQSERLEVYRHHAERLVEQGRAYYCACSRKELAANNGRHPWHCRDGDKPPTGRPVAIRFALHAEEARWQDRILGEQHQQVRAELDDPVIIRKEGFVAYQLAVVVDDIDQGITEIVRGSDLLETTAQQRQICLALGGTPPQWAHIPVVLNEQGQKLSKQNHAPALDDEQPGRNLWRALGALGQQPEEDLAAAPPQRVLEWALEHWSMAGIPHQSTMDSATH
ncbi:tRNA glutamyl-Q(34) synthetase GluQRS [Marinobacter bryozoorum]|jgi:glutamyl-Q tRNA(Asp) synthetase|uniref:tRNA glutamyl-Q(34) synthetase GluQRS n=1 Tax=Marinobacter bryozoorum TaxID=256324 RepID=UPI002003E1D7|nr:tRNA glutamyl-Q(34) synthetase GluQRS [Marinobacter bryozoorum]MCK7545558.1 tRNA glutamyl-Q(34) synthetase GluQRS [Marinobacter bryozoorum]